MNFCKKTERSSAIFRASSVQKILDIYAFRKSDLTCVGVFWEWMEGRQCSTSGGKKKVLLFLSKGKFGFSETI